MHGRCYHYFYIAYSGGSRISHWEGAGLLGGAPTSNAYTFQQKHMWKQKKLILLGGGEGCVLVAPPWIRQWLNEAE